MLPSLEEGGTEGVMKFVKGVNDELRYIMSCTGFSKVEYIDDTCLVREAFKISLVKITYKNY